MEVLARAHRVGDQNVAGAEFLKGIPSRRVVELAAASPAGNALLQIGARRQETQSDSPAGQMKPR